MPLRRLFALICACLFLLVTVSARADEIRPAFLQLTPLFSKDSSLDVSQSSGQSSANQPVQQFEVLWKVPARRDGDGNFRRLALDVHFDGATEVPLSASLQSGSVAALASMASREATLVEGAWLQRWVIERPGGLAGLQVRVDGLVDASLEVLLQVQGNEQAGIVAQVHRLTPTSPDYTFAAEPGRMEVVQTYTILGIEHILIGVDHLLFVLVLLMLVRDLRKLVWTITAFTAAHSITLSLAALELVRVPVPPVEACIALSIVFVAREILRARQGEDSLAQRQPWLVAFSFGLLHGLGFAAALSEIGLPGSEIPAALLFFNVGVEIGQLLFVGAVLSLLWLARKVWLEGRAHQQWPEPVQVVPVYVVGILAAFWTIERVAGFVV